MNQLIHLKSTLIHCVRGSIRRSPLQRGPIVVVLTLINLGLPAQVKAVDVTDTSYGTGALNGSSTGSNDSAFGYNALNSDTYGSANTAIGAYALINNTSGYFNTATGFGALEFNTTASYNTAIGASTLLLSSTGYYNTASGYGALQDNSAGNYNTATGYEALLANSTGNYNTATGGGALFNNTANNNTANGFRALYNNTTGTQNVGLGLSAGYSLTTGSGNVCIGAGILGVAGESNTTRIRNVYSSVASGRAVYVKADNKIGTLSSSRRYKEEIKPMDKASEAIHALKPVTFRYKKEVDPARALSFGLIAEEVAKVSPDLITRDEDGKPQTVRYEAVNAMLLNEFLKEHRKVQKLEAAAAQQQTEAKVLNELKSTVAKQETIIAHQQKQIEALASGLEKVSAQLEASKAAPQIVASNTQ